MTTILLIMSEPADQLNFFLGLLPTMHCNGWLSLLKFPSEMKYQSHIKVQSRKMFEITLGFFFFDFTLWQILLVLCFDFWPLWKELSKNHQNGEYFANFFFMFGTAQTKYQQWAWVFQWIGTNWNIPKMLEKLEN